jgi:hypothetical protein
MNMFKPTVAKTPAEYIKMIDEPRRSEIKTLDALIRKAVPKLKRHIISGVIGYGKYHYKYSSGREGDWFIVGLGSRKQYISLYLSACTEEGEYVAEKLRKKLPKANIGKSCIRFKKIEDIDLNILESAIKETARLLR